VETMHALARLTLTIEDEGALQNTAGKTGSATLRLRRTTVYEPTFPASITPKDMEEQCTYRSLTI